MPNKNEGSFWGALSPNRADVAGPPPGELEQDLVVERGDIEFFDATRERVCLRIGVRNTSGRPSPSRLVALYTAPLGAFLPWRHLETLTIRSLQPGARMIAQTEALKPRTSPLRRIDRIRPRRVEAALAKHEARERRARSKRLAPSVMDFTRTRSDNWLGNIEVFLNNNRVERHCGRGLQVQPGVLNWTVFMVGWGIYSEAYSFRIHGDSKGWKPRLFAVPLSARTMNDTSGGTAIPEGRWMEASAVRFVRLQFRPPERSRRGTIDVEVAQRSSGLKAVIEYSFDAEAAGPGCAVR